MAGKGWAVPMLQPTQRPCFRPLGKGGKSPWAKPDKAESQATDEFVQAVLDRRAAASQNQPTPRPGLLQSRAKAPGPQAALPAAAEPKQQAAHESTRMQPRRQPWVRSPVDEDQQPWSSQPQRPATLLQPKVLRKAPGAAIAEPVVPDRPRQQSVPLGSAVDNFSEAVSQSIRVPAPARRTRVRIQGLPRAWRQAGEAVASDRALALLGQFGELDLTAGSPSFAAVKHGDSKGTFAVTATFAEEDAAIAVLRTLQDADSWVLDELLEGDIGCILDEDVSLTTQLVIDQASDSTSEQRVHEHECEEGMKGQGAHLKGAKSHDKGKGKKVMQGVENIFGEAVAAKGKKDAKGTKDVDLSRSAGKGKEDLSRSQDTYAGKGVKGFKAGGNESWEENDTESWQAKGKVETAGKSQKGSKGDEDTSAGKGKDNNSLLARKGKQPSKAMEVDDAFLGKGKRHAMDAEQDPASKGSKGAKYVKGTKASQKPCGGKGAENEDWDSGKSEGKAVAKGVQDPWTWKDTVPMQENATSSTGPANIGGPARVRISSCPTEWRVQQCNQILSRFGRCLLEDSALKGPGRFEVTFADLSFAESAVLALAGQQVQGKAGPHFLACELLPTTSGPKSEEASSCRRVAKHINAEVFGEVAGKGAPIIMYLDEFQEVAVDNSGKGKEVWLRQMPLDYSVKELEEWLHTFGDVEDILLLQDKSSGSLSGSGYVRFATHDDATVLIQSIPKDSDGTGLEACWSYSEHVASDSSGQLRESLCRVLAANFQKLQNELQWHGLALVGDGKEEGRLRLAVWLHSRSSESVEAAHDRLRELVVAVVSDTPVDPSTAAVAAPQPPLAAPTQKVSPAATAEKLAPTKKGSPAPPAQKGSQMPGATQAAAAQKETSSVEWFDVRPSSEMDLSWLKRKETSSDDGVPGAKRRKGNNDVEEDAREESVSGPSIFVQGFPDNWTTSHIEALFTKFGGASSICFLEDPIGRAASVKLSNVRRMAWAAESLNGQTCGTERCLQCELVGVEATDATEEDEHQKDLVPSKRFLFIDELAMPDRPDVNPGEKDREVFLRNISRSIVVDEDLNAWLSEFGDVDNVFILKDNLTLQPVGKAYVRFKTRAAAAACIAKHAAPQDDGASAVWSESERAVQRLASSYRSDIHRIFVDSSGRILHSVLARAEVEGLHMHTPVQRPGARPMPRTSDHAAAQRLHFVVEGATRQQLEELRAALGEVLDEFHQQVAQKQARQTSQRTALSGPAGSSEISNDPNMSLNNDTKVSTAAAEAHTEAVPRRQAQVAAGTVADDPLASFYDDRPAKASQGSDYPATSSRKDRPRPDDPIASFYEGRPASSAQQDREANGKRRQQAEELSSKGDVGLMRTETDSLLETTIEDAEALILEAHDLEAEGNADEAYSTYCQGVEKFLKTVQQLTRQDEDKRGLEQKVRKHLAQAKNLQQRLDKAGITTSSLFPKSAPPWREERPKSGRVIGSNARSRSRSRGARPPPLLPKASAKGGVLVRPVSKAHGMAPGERHAPRPPSAPPPANLRTQSSMAEASKAQPTPPSVPPLAALKVQHPLAVTKAKALRSIQKPVPKSKFTSKAGVSHPIGAPGRR